MTPIFCCGFECGRLGNVGQHFNGIDTCSIVTTGAITGNRSLRCNPSASDGYAQRTFAATNTLVVGMRIRFDTLPNATTYIAKTEPGTEGVVFDSTDGKLYCNSTGGWTGVGFPVSTGSTYYITIRFDLSANPHK